MQLVLKQVEHAGLGAEVRERLQIDPRRERLAGFRLRQREKEKGMKVVVGGGG